MGGIQSALPPLPDELVPDDENARLNSSCILRIIENGLKKSNESVNKGAMVAGAFLRAKPDS
jgi:hypothetical protein